MSLPAGTGGQTIGGFMEARLFPSNRPDPERFHSPDRSCINYRFVVNDAVCWAWEPMPEAGATLADLVEFLKGCLNCDRLGHEWDHERLKYGGSFDNHSVDYGLRAQFWIPVIPKAEDFTWTTAADLPVRCCGREVKAETSYDARSTCPDEGWMYYCRTCERHTRLQNGDVHRTARKAHAAWLAVNAAVLASIAEEMQHGKEESKR